MIHSTGRSLAYLCFLLPLLCLATSCVETNQEETKQTEIKKIEVTATAYNSVESQTKAGDSTTAAWGDELSPGMKAIAVSRDLIQAGLDHNTTVKIEGLPGTYRVLDKLNKRWTNRIDIYMGNDVAQAKEWGKQTVEISWEADTAN